VSITTDLVEAVWSIRYGDLTDADLAATRTLLLDHIAVTACGSATESALAAQRWSRTLGEDSSSFPLIGREGCLPAIPAALANAVAAHSIEYDDVHNASSLHPGTVIFPAAMAIATITGATTEDFLTAVVRGYEVMCRVGRAANPPAEYARHFHPTATVGHLGAGAAAASLLGLDQAKTVWALGIASTMAGGGMQFLVDGSWTKRFHPALATQNGINAARLASESYDGGEDGIGGSRGFLASHSADPHPELLLEDFGTAVLEVQATSIKAHTCCRYNQGPIDAVLALRAAHGLRVGDVERVIIGVPTAAVGIVAEPRADKVRPKNTVDAQFSLPFGIAVALLNGHAGLEEYTPAMLENREVIQLMDRVSFEVDPEIDSFYPRQWRAWAKITLANGESFNAQVTDPKGDPTNALTHEEMRMKFDELTCECWSAERRERIVALIEGLGESGSLSDLSEAMTLVGANA
jgi:2-methylcitrate dehydratase PrpD